MIGRKINDQDNDHERLVYNSMIKIMITKPKKTTDHLVMIIQLMNIFMTCKDCGAHHSETQQTSGRITHEVGDIHQENTQQVGRA